ncbi:related to plasma membrane ammonium transporter (Ato3) [Phialocephala subalpina]|jgi:succinate-acetate transporter protein|uniref:Related to plasma membrane ammonium transporter (Ato3) n=1 Tax=Phialocephala subalpina TaxID=576137 RepID=A0A1L7XWB7_9HELO|nr:related to plasma membrane ammonium transporter (Ato3) [Phialocephala subalpina]
MAETNGISHRKTLNEEISEDMGSHLHQLKSSGQMTISPELFEKLYLTPKTAPVGDFRKRFANPTPLGLMGFVIAALTYAMIMMGWGGSTTLTGVAGIFYFTGPVLLLLALIFEWIMGNFFSMMVMGMFAVFWLSFAILETPSFGAAASYSATGNAAEGAASVGYNAGIALYLLVWGFWLFTTFIFTLKTNTVFALIFFCAFISSFLFSGAYWKVSTGDYGTALKLQKAGGGMFFVLALLGYYITVVMMAAEMRITVNLPVGDLSHFWPNPEKELADMEKGE